MITREELRSHLHDLLNCAAYDDYCVNGLQIEGKERIERVATGVSASRRLFAAAVKMKVDAVIVHHGLFWRNTRHPLALTGVLKGRVAALVKRDINLFAYHLPLDGHPDLGNNALIARALRLQDVSVIPVEGTKSPPMMAIGRLPRPMSFETFCRMADGALEAKGIHLRLAKSPVRAVAVLSGGGAGYWQSADEAGADVLVTGEMKEEAVRAGEEAGINFYAGGHYNTEKWGVRALGEHLAGKFGLEVTFVDVPNPV